MTTVPSRTAGEGRMSLDGTINRASFLLACVVAPALWMWSSYSNLTPRTALITAIVCLLGAIIVAWVTIRDQTWAPITAPAYAVLEGIAVGGSSTRLEMRYHGIAIQAVALTFAVFFCLLVAYRSGLVRVTQGFKTAVLAATAGVSVFYAASFLLFFLGVRHLTLFNGGIPGIIVSLVVVVVASLNLVVDFDFIRECSGRNFPKYMEWYTAMGLIVTLIWLYLELLRLLGKMRKAEGEN